MSDIANLLREAAIALRDYERDGLAANLEAAAESLHWAQSNPGLADQYRAEALACRVELGFAENSDEVSPRELQDAISRLIKAPKAPGERTESDYMDDYEKGCVDGWNNCRETMLAATEADAERLQEVYEEGWYAGRNTTSVCGPASDWAWSETKAAIDTGRRQPP